jgi:hypothetical protein
MIEKAIGTTKHQNTGAEPWGTNVITIRTSVMSTRTQVISTRKVQFSPTECDFLRIM